jgi:hypothetical protein
LENLVERSFDFELFLDDSHQHIDRDCDPDLTLDRIFGCAVESFDSKMLFDPFEKEFDLPTVFVEKSNG